MKVILIKDVPGLGEEGETKEVAPGHARNFLFPKGFVVEDSPFNRNRRKEQKKRIELKKIKKKEDAQKLAEKVKTRIRRRIMIKRCNPMHWLRSAWKWRPHGRQER